ncbi:flagellar basal body rod protein FlgC [Persicimonas caeni]|jgi:flagellar basal-body rod protein FlgC|uniref:Flagellar basal-body rod protein FlgC n=1 Tax=Persicimonas caeni TaxID=2292766 RepID=A0A4Y6PTH6_PERCE|nr:flagellar basal body rod protein FlgC [Persicimonas caeni]QDG51327.1 flagellar basal body rod protein FlgC [Persicimonas caeni]QED32548.1 flagellar basal body rod protein FlgC [Persicimonas caeni]
MSFLTGMEVAASGLSAQRTRLDVTASNLANAETTRTAEGGPYQRRQVIFEARRAEDFGRQLDGAVRRVDVSDIEVDAVTPGRLVYDPGHPDADLEGYVQMPNVDVVEEMTEMVMASRSYEANATSFETLKNMAQRALSIG